MIDAGLDIEVLGIELLVPDAPTALEVGELCVLALASAGIEEGHMAVEFVPAERIHALNPHVQFAAHATWLTAHNAMGLIGSYDLVLDGSDNGTNPDPAGTGNPDVPAENVPTRVHLMRHQPWRRKAERLNCWRS